MLIFITFLGILILGIMFIIGKEITDKLYWKWITIENKIGPTLKDLCWDDKNKTVVMKKNNPLFDEKLYKKAITKRKFYATIKDTPKILGWIFIIISSMAIFFYSINYLSENVGINSKNDYENMIIERQEIILALEENNVPAFKYKLNFNKKLNEIKNYYKNLWTNWTVNNKIAKDIDYIKTG